MASVYGRCMLSKNNEDDSASLYHLWRWKTHDSKNVKLYIPFKNKPLQKMHSFPTL